MKRWYISQIVGTGTDTDPYRAKVGGSALIKGHSAIIPTGANGVPLYNWALVLVEAADHSLLMSDSGNEILPNKQLGAVFNSSERALIKAALSRWGLPAALIDNAVTYRGFIRALAQRLDPQAAEDRLNVGA